MSGPDGGPLDDALVLGDHGRIEAVGAWRDLRHGLRCDVTDLGGSVLAPGLVNAHVHLELSHISQGLCLGQGFLPWVQSLVPRLREPLPDEALDAALAQILDCGASFVADITGRSSGAVARSLASYGLDCWLFLEAFGFAGEMAGGPDGPCGRLLPVWAHERVAAAGHAPYSTHPELLRRAKLWSAERGRPFSLHLAEPEGEAELLRTGGGDLAEFYTRAGILPRDFRPPGLSSVAYADSLGLLDAATLAVHCVHVDADDIHLLTARGVTVCLCPRSNARMAVGRAPWEAMLDAGTGVCLATDGLTSNADLDLWNELRFFRAGLDRPLGLAQALAMLTFIPARALCLAGAHGSMVPGGKAAFSILPEDVAAWPAGKIAA